MKRFVIDRGLPRTSNTIGLNLRRDDDRSIDLGTKASPDTARELPLCLQRVRRTKRISRPRIIFLFEFRTRDHPDVTTIN